MTTLKDRLDYLDSIRGVAALLVFVDHALKHTPWAISTIDMGRVGVIVFFLVSGLVIPWSLERRYKNAVTVFMLKRFFRLFPVYWLSICVGVLTAFSVTSVAWENYGLIVDSNMQILANFSMIQRVFGFSNIIGAYWTLFIELVFYALCALLFLFAVLNRLRYQVGLVIFFTLITLGFVISELCSNYELPTVVPISLASMFLGSIVKKYVIDENRKLKKMITLLALFHLAVLSACFFLLYNQGFLKWVLTYTIGFALFFVFLLLIKLKTPIFVYFGKISYSFYLFHQLSIGIVFSLVQNYSVSTNPLTAVALSFVTSTLIAIISYETIEKYSIRYSKNKVNSMLKINL